MKRKPTEIEPNLISGGGSGLNILFFHFFLLGCACRFLYGPETKDDHKSQIEKSLDGKIELKLEVIFYKKNGEWFIDVYLTDRRFKDYRMCVFNLILFHI